MTRQFVKSKHTGLGGDPMYGLILNAEIKYIKTLFGNTQIIATTVMDLVNKDVVQDVILSPGHVATVQYWEDVPDKVMDKFKKNLLMIGADILKQLSLIRNIYALNYQQAEFLLLAFYLQHGDRAAKETHLAWKEYCCEEKDNPVKKVSNTSFIDRGELIYLTDEDIQGLIETGFFEKLNNRTFKINREKFFTEIFITKQVAYQQFTNLFRDMFITIKGSNYRINNVTSRTEGANDYWESIGGLAKKHKEVMEACEYAIDSDLVTVGLNKIIANEIYFDWMKIKDGEIEVDDEEYVSKINIVV